MPEKYFMKELVYNQVFDRHGNGIQFEQTGSFGFLILTEQRHELIQDLEKMAADRVGGVIVLTEQEYHKKKDAIPNLSQFAKPPEMVRALPTRHNPLGSTPPAESAVAGNPPPPVPPAPQAVIPTEEAPVVLPQSAPLRKGRAGARKAVAA